MDEVTKIKGEIPLCMIFAYDIVLIGQNLDKVNNRLSEWKLDFEGMGLRIIRCKTEYIAYEFGKID